MKKYWVNWCKIDLNRALSHSNKKQLFNFDRTVSISTLDQMFKRGLGDKWRQSCLREIGLSVDEVYAHSIHFDLNFLYLFQVK